MVIMTDGVKFLTVKLLAEGSGFICCSFVAIGDHVSGDCLKWSGKKAFGTSPTVKFVVDGVDAGSLNNYGPLSFLKVYEAGHMVPMDQPKAALEMLKRWMGGKLATHR
ncbi:hypothetical protein V8G54_003764 [Vigna mungo]|uniref:Uncharacterized protein n=1 Tax=Vigna mungo TaxID=3915 RepID=A0AAQ3PEF8_VIGMU